MKRVASVLGVAAAGLLATACATTTRDTARMESRTTLASSAALSGTNSAEVVGKTAIAWGDTYTAANLFERAADSRDSVGKKFNLAGAYMETGRLQQAAALYSELAREGEYTWAVSGRRIGAEDTPVRRYNIADESARRLALIVSQNPYLFPQQTGGALAASSFATPVSATVGGAPTGRISDDQAIALDAANGG